jgi:hypothetical protein
MKKLTILRGCPGAGKSRYARDFPEALVVSPDNYRYKGDRYVYIHNDPMPFEKSQEAVDAALKDSSFQHVIVDSTNINEKSFKPYIRGKVDVNVVTIVPESAMVAFKRCLHGVPYPTVYRMYHEALMSHPLNYAHEFKYWYEV